MCEPDVARTLATAIGRICVDPQLRDLGAAARLRAVERFSIGAMVKRYSHFYHELASGTLLPGDATAAQLALRQDTTAAALHRVERTSEGTRKPSVLLIGPLPPPVGGMGSAIENLVAGLGSRCDLSVLSNTKTTPADRSLLEGVKAQLRLLAKLRDTLRRERPHIVHIHTCSQFTFWRNALDVLIARLYGCRVVLHVHGATFHRFLDSLSPAPAWCARRVFQACDVTVALGEQWRQVLRKWCPNERIRVVANGVFVPEEAAGEERVSTGHTEIVCLANYERRKGHADLLRALTILPPAVHLRCAGAEIAPGLRDELWQLATELGISDRVELLGPVVGEAKEALLRHADIFCLPSHDEGLPMAMLEAMAYGLPVTVTRVGAISDAVADGVEGLLYEVGDVDALAAALNGLCQDPSHARALGLAGRRRVEREFSLEAMAVGVLGIYWELL